MNKPVPAIHQIAEAARRAAGLFQRLARAGRISRELADHLRAAAGFRNILVHGYAEVDVRVTRDVLEHHLGDLLACAEALRQRSA